VKTLLIKMIFVLEGRLGQKATQRRRTGVPQEKKNFEPSGTRKLEKGKDRKGGSRGMIKKKEGYQKWTNGDQGASLVINCPCKGMQESGK